MTRFSTPKSIMRFISGKEAIVTIPTPLGIQHFVTATKRYQLNRSDQSVQLQYELKGLENQQVLLPMIWKSRGNNLLFPEKYS